jgi:hypothetical protein
MAAGENMVESPGHPAPAAKIRLPPIGFWSYARQDDDLSRGKLSGLRSLLMFELQQQHGRDQIQIFQDVRTIPHGAAWERETCAALGKATFFVPIVTPNFVQSDWCCREVTLFLEREAELQRLYPDLPRRSRIFPIQFIDIEDVDAADPAALAALQSLQWFDFRKFRHRSYDSETVREAIAELAGSMRDLLKIKVSVGDEHKSPTAAESLAEAEAAARKRQRRAEQVEAKAARLAVARETKAQAAHEAERKADARRRQEAERLRQEADEAKTEQSREAYDPAGQERQHAELDAERGRRLAGTAAASKARRARRTKTAGGAALRKPWLLLGLGLSLLLAAIIFVPLLRSPTPPAPTGSPAAAPSRGPSPSAAARPATSTAPVREFDRTWLYHRWCVDGSASNVQTIRGDAHLLVTVFSGQRRQEERVNRIAEGSIGTNVATYTLNPDRVSVTVEENGYRIQLKRCR